jgi:hypothetical protein
VAWDADAAAPGGVCPASPSGTAVLDDPQARSALEGRWEKCDGNGPFDPDGPAVGFSVRPDLTVALLVPNGTMVVESTDTSDTGTAYIMKGCRGGWCISLSFPARKEIFAFGCAFSSDLEFLSCPLETGDTIVFGRLSRSAVDGGPG